MSVVLKRMSWLCAGAVLLGCAGTGHRLDARVPGVHAQEAYLIARSHHLARRPDQASVHYMDALRAAPQHMAARNGLAALYAEQGYFGRAIALWEAMLPGAEAGQGEAYLFSNIGYAYFLNGDLDKARVALERACLLDPLNHRARAHLGNTQARLGQSVPADELPELRPLRDWAQTEVVQAPGGMLVMRRIEALSSTAPMVASSAATPLSRPRLEIRNGNGVRGMAASMAQDMSHAGAEVVRVSNHKGFGIRQTRIEYQPAFRAAAQALALQVGARQLVPVGAVGRVELRLILGTDLLAARVALLAAPPKARPARPG